MTCENYLRKLAHARDSGPGRLTCLIMFAYWGGARLRITIHIDLRTPLMLIDATLEMSYVGVGY